jgi:hypothetical protein
MRLLWSRRTRGREEQAVLRRRQGGPAVRRAARRDAVEPLIVLSLERRGYAVALVSADGHPDLLVSRGDAVYLLECKDPGAPNRTKEHAVYRGALIDLPRTLTPAQARWWKRWLAAGGKMPVIVSSVDEALAVVGAR